MVASVGRWFGLVGRCLDLTIGPIGGPLALLVLRCLTLTTTGPTGGPMVRRGRDAKRVDGRVTSAPVRLLRDDGPAGRERHLQASPDLLVRHAGQLRQVLDAGVSVLAAASVSEGREPPKHVPHVVAGDLADSLALL
jgi:hypothetical protein